MLGYAIDVSHHQDPDALPWESFRGHVDAVMVRAAYGIRLDERARGHVQRARRIGAKVGLYLFFVHAQSESDQFVALQRAAESCGIGTGDVVPALDIEDDDGPVSPSWAPKCESIVEKIVDCFGDAIIYTTQRCFGMLGRPEWLLHRPLWVADWRDVSTPATPGGMPATLWQHRVGPFLPNGLAGYDKAHPELDQSRILQPLPLVGYRPTEDDRARVAALVSETLRSGVQEADTDPSELLAFNEPDEPEGHPV